MQPASSHAPEHPAAEPAERRNSARGTLGWAAFLVIAVVVVAAVFAGAIHARLSPGAPDAGVKPSLPGAPSPSPSPLPRPGSAPPSGARLARL